MDPPPPLTLAIPMGQEHSDKSQRAIAQWGECAPRTQPTQAGSLGTEAGVSPENYWVWSNLPLPQ